MPTIHSDTTRTSTDLDDQECRAGTRRPRRARAGFTLVDVMMAAVVLAVAISGVCGSIVVSMSLNRVNRDTAVAQQAARLVLEEIESRTFNEVFAAYNADAGDNAGLLSAAPGANFVVAGLEPLDGDADGMCGRIMFPTQVAGGVEQLREDFVDPALGMPRDLNSDAVVDALDHATNYRVLPVRVRIEWQGSTGPRSVDIETMLCQR
ncbi:MAG TPA: hypothetical protein VK843_02645 [Planctomycetota bacterium]|nr:hypothetical protein [Planctomycetota bacterium]